MKKFKEKHNNTNSKSNKCLVAFDIYSCDDANDCFHSYKKPNEDLCENIDLQNVPKDIV
jgi:hypothetical protein